MLDGVVVCRSYRVIYGRVGEGLVGALLLVNRKVRLSLDKHKYTMHHDLREM